MFKFKPNQLLITTLCVLVQCVCAVEYLRGSGEANSSPSPTGKDASEWSYIIYVVLGAAAVVIVRYVCSKLFSNNESSDRA